MPFHTNAERAKQSAKLAIRQDLSGTVESRGLLSGEADRRGRVNRANPDFNVGSGPGRKKKKVIRTPLVDPTKPKSPVTPISNTEDGGLLGGGLKALQSQKDRLDKVFRETQ